MLSIATSLLLAFLLAFYSPPVAASSQYCKPIPGSPKWPSLPEWQALNRTVDGHLISPTPPGVVCQPGSVAFNNASCAEVVAGWANSDWHAKDPFTSNYNDDTCLPNALAPCSKAGYPVYVVNATNSAHVQAGVRFAHRTGVRLIVKGTGHDFPGRSSGPNSLSIYTHNIRGIHINRNSAPARAHGGVAAVKIAAGMRMFEIYNATKNANLTVVGGGDLNVGIGGWIMGGAHSPISAYYGMGADQVLEMEVVTPDGEYRVIHQKSYPELFWAMRGGGGSTYAVMLSVTVKAYPQLPTIIYSFAFNTTGLSDTYWNMLAYFHSQLPTIAEKGGMGYYYMVPNDSSEGNTTHAGKLLGAFLFPHKTLGQTNAILKPILDHLNSKTEELQDNISIETISTPPLDFTTMWLTNAPAGVGIDGRLGSYLLSNDSLLGNLTALKEALKTTTPDSASISLGHLVSGPGVHHAKIPGGGNAVHPAWRKAYTHVVLPRTWPYLNATAKEALTADLRHVRVPALKALEPDSGAYVNEADPTNPAWKKDYWGGGKHYERLLKVKKKWDPDGVFWCKPCVGHDMWEVKGGDGVGQDGVQLCRK